MDKIIVITPRVYIPRFATKIKGRWKKWFIDPVTSIEGRVEIFRPHVLSFPSFRFAGANGIIMQYALSELAIELAAKNKLDIILGNNMLPEGIAAEMLARKLNLPVVNWCIGTDINDFAEHNYLNHYLTKKCIKRSNMILTASNKLESKVREYAQNNNNVMTFYRGIDLLNFKNENKSDNTETDIKSDQGSKFILFVGRLLKTKGIYELAEAFIAVNNIYPDIKLIMIGEETEKADFLRSLKYDKIRKMVILKGIISHYEIAKYMKAAEMLVFPSWAEGLPNVVIEAMASGLPVVSSDVGGIPEVLTNGITGLSVPSHNVEKLIEAIVKMIGDSELKKKCTANAKKLVYENFDVNKNAEKLYGLLHQVKKQYVSHH